MVELGGVRDFGSVLERVATSLLLFLSEAWPGLFLFFNSSSSLGKKGNVLPIFWYDARHTKPVL